MKKLLTALLTLSLLIGCALADGGFPDSYAVVNNPNPEDRLNLREQPSRRSTSLVKYFNGTVVDIIEEEDDTWVFVHIGQTSGYMMKAYLADPGAGVEPCTPVAVISDPYSRYQWLRSSTLSGAAYLVCLPVGSQVTVLGLTKTHAHVQVGGITGYLPLSCLDMTQEKEEEPLHTESLMPLPESLAGTLSRATLYMHQEALSITDAAQLNFLSSLLVNTEYRGYQEADCPLGAVLMLEYASGRIAVIELATDHCTVYRYNGHDYVYATNLHATGSEAVGDWLFHLFGVSPVG